MDKKGCANEKQSERKKERDERNERRERKERESREPLLSLPLHSPHTTAFLPLPSFPYFLILQKDDSTRVEAGLRTQSDTWCG